mgnify:CR=1 FL=1
MTDEEMDRNLAKIEEAEEEVNEWWNSLSEEDKKKEAEKSKDTRLWEDWTDCDPVTNSKSRSSEK